MYIMCVYVCVCVFSSINFYFIFIIVLTYFEVSKNLYTYMKL